MARYSIPPSPVGLSSEKSAVGVFRRERPLTRSDEPREERPSLEHRGRGRGALRSASSEGHRHRSDSRRPSERSAPPDEPPGRDRPPEDGLHRIGETPRPGRRISLREPADRSADRRNPAVLPKSPADRRRPCRDPERRPDRVCCPDERTRSRRRSRRESRGVAPRVFSHLSKITLPEPRMAQQEDLARLDPTDELLQSQIHSLRVGSLLPEPQSLLQQIFVKHKTRTFHA